MDVLEYILITLSVIAALFLLATYLVFRFCFYVKRKKNTDRIPLPKGKVYEPYHEAMTQWVLEARAMPCEKVSILSFDGLKLCGKYYEYAPGAPVELMFHGYRGSAERDLSGGVHRCFRLGHSALIVEQRTSNDSEGHVITFGIHEHRDCLDWIDFAVEHFGSDVKIILTGISMGASTVLMAAGNKLPDQVIGVLADCGFTTAKDIMFHVMQAIGLPPKLCYPLVKLGARIFGHFDLEAYSALEAMDTCTVPVIFFHGEEDDFVPCEMSRVNFEACKTRKQLVLVPGAGHGLSFPAAPEVYLAELEKFFG